MEVHQVKEITSEWLSRNLGQYPGLSGAHFVGSINSLPDEAFFPPYKDVDFHLIFTEGSPVLEKRGPFMDILETEYRGVILEGGYKPISDYRTSEAVLANAEIAHHLTVDSIFYDPDGWLLALQKPVRQEYARRKWVLSRIAYERQMVEQWWEIRPRAQAMDRSGFIEISLLGYHMTFLTALLCIATLQSPSSNLNQTRTILGEYGRLDLFDEAMSILGIQNFQVDRVKKLLEEGAEAYDLAVSVKRTPSPMQHKLNAHQRRYFVDACQSLLEAGFIEEATGRALAFYIGSILVILTDGPEEVKSKYETRRDQLVELLEMNTQEKRDERFSRMRSLDEQFFSLAETIVHEHAAVFD